LVCKQALGQVQMGHQVEWAETHCGLMELGVSFEERVRIRQEEWLGMDNQNVLQMGLVQHNSVGRQNPPSSYYMLVEEHHLNAGKAEPRMNRFLKTYRNDVSLGQKSWSLLYSRIQLRSERQQSPT